MNIYVLLYDVDTDFEGIHSISLKDKTVVLMFEDPDDAYRYSSLLEAQDFPSPSVNRMEIEDIKLFCNESGYEARLVEKGFIPKSIEDRLMILPPEKNKDVSNWKADSTSNDINLNVNTASEDLDSVRAKLEDLL